MKSSYPIDFPGLAAPLCVIVLAFLLIITAMVVAFLSSITTEDIARRAPQASVDGVQQLADAVPQIAIARIRDATSAIWTPPIPSSATVSWASQPGMIRTYQSNGAPGPYYRLHLRSSRIHARPILQPRRRSSSG